MKKFIATCIIGIGLFGSLASADNTLSVGIGINTVHPFDDVEYNNDNQMIAVSYGSDKIGGFVGTMKNSYYHRSNLAGMYLRKSFRSDIFVTLRVGGVTGYTKEQMPPCWPHPVCVYAAPSIGIALTDTISYEVLVFGEAIVQAVSINF
jgi:hypothetical protein